MLKNKIIKPSEATAHCQVFLVPKPNNKWRFCIDFRNMNACCTRSSWPIPNIKMMLARLGALHPRPKYFAKIDFTFGYHQAPLSKSTSPLTFITVFGFYEWLRIPMGIVVLVGLLYIFVEVYIDDILVHASTEDSLIKRLDIVFQRFRKHKITLNPENDF